jgi:ketosteroid isomerase-like protein
LIVPARTPTLLLATIVAGILAVAAGCGGDDGDSSEEAGTGAAVTTAPAKDSARRTADDADRPCTNATAEAGGSACDEVGNSPHQQVDPGVTTAAAPGENAEVVRRFYDAWNRRDFDETVRPFHEDFELHARGGSANAAGERFDGRDGLLRFLRRVAGTVGGQVTVERTIERGERVAVIGALKPSRGLLGALPGVPFRQVWTFRDAKVIRVDSYAR